MGTPSSWRTAAARAGARGAALAGCARAPAEILAVAPRRALGDGAVQLVDDPCSRTGALVAPVDVGPLKAWLLVDTGAYNHVLLPSIAHEAGLRPRGDVVRVGRGEGMRAHLIDAELTIPGLPRIAQPVLSLELSAMTPCGQAGLLAPAQLTTLATALVLDLPGRVMHLEPDHGPPPPAAIDFRANFDGALYVADATVDGVAARLLVDTGADRSWVFAESPAGRALWPRARAVDDGAVDIQGHRTTHRAEATIAVGATTWSTQVDLMPGEDPPGGDHGAIGIPELRGCVLTLRTDQLTGACDVATPGARRR